VAGRAMLAKARRESISPPSRPRASSGELI
jgi:hypothetical protein